MASNFKRFITFPYIVLYWVIGYMVLIPIWQTLESSSNWMTVESVRVSSVFQGQDPIMIVDRSMNLDVPTRGIWIGKIVNSDDEAVCTNDGTALYTPTAKLPKPETLRLFDWWLDAGRIGGPDRICFKWPLPPGKYCLKTQWEFFPKNYPVSKLVNAPLGCFLVLRKPWYLRMMELTTSPQ